MASWRITVRGMGAAALALEVWACTPQAPPGVLVGESAHFRLFVDPDLTGIPSGLAGESGLVALETEWADVQTMLKMPDGKIDYYWLTLDHVHKACGDVFETGCTWEDRMEIDAPTLPHAHELNHAYSYLRSRRHPVPFLAEGFADAIGCDYDLAPSSISELAPLALVAALPSPELASQGSTLMRHLIRTQGIDAVLRYYEQSPERRDPALFAANFEAFWNLPFEQVWAAAVASPPGVARQDSKICPCTLASLPTVGAIDDAPSRVLYWTLPDAGEESIALTSGRAQDVRIRDCAGIAPDIAGKEVLARLDAGTRRYLLPTVVSATRDHYISDDCAGAALFHLPADFLVGGDVLSVAIVATGSPVVTAQVAIDVPAPVRLRASGARWEICDGCQGSAGVCQTVNGSVSSTPVQGTVHGTLTLYPGASQVPPSVLSTDLGFTP